MMNALTLDMVTVFHDRAFASVEADLKSDGFYVLQLDGSSAVDKSTFLAAVERDLPVSPGLHAKNWDALIDVLSDGLDRADADRVAVVWRRADRLETADLQVFVNAVLALTVVVRRIYDRAGSRERRALVILLGDAPNSPMPPS